MNNLSNMNISETDIAIVGMAGRFPGAKNIKEFWQNLKNGVESVTVFSDRELKAAGVDPALLKDPDYVKAGVVMDEIEMFDAGFFGFSPREASIMDPQHRHFLECAWEALESAGYVPENFPGSIGVYGGCGMNAYMMFNLLTNQELVKNSGLFLLRHTGNDKDFLTTRVSYELNLRGPSVNVQTACSTSLVAAHIACQSLLNGECDMAIAGGVTIENPHKQGYLYKEGEILSPDGHCRAFDHRSKGTVIGSGVGMVVLRRLTDAVKDGNHIHAVIKASAINNDGSNKVGYLAPSVDGQSEAINVALAISGIDPETITYVETHGTGTPIGDPIEIAALKQAFGSYTDKKGFCKIGSLKSNIGHLDTAAGVASLIKTTLALENKQIPPSLNFEKPNPTLSIEDSPFSVNDKLIDWNPEDSPRRAGVSSLGVGGTNAHVILEEAPELPSSGKAKDWQILVWSARSENAAGNARKNLAEFLKQNPNINIGDVSYTLQTGRRSFNNRQFAVCEDIIDAADVLENQDEKKLFKFSKDENNSSVVFMYPGGGAQYPNMGLELYRSEKIYKESVEKCFKILEEKYSINLRELMFPSEIEKAKAKAAESLQDPLNSILSIFITEYALSKLWMSWGIKPAAMTGHSLGEYSAACIAGVMTLEEALSIVELRGRIFRKLPIGGMTSIPLSEEEVKPLLTEGVTIATINAPGLSVVSGRVEDIEKFERGLEEKEIEYNRLKISVAAHSSMLDPYLGEFEEGLRKLDLQPPVIPFISNLSGSWITKSESTDPKYWVRQLRNTVRFSDGMTELMKEENKIFLEAGPGTTLSSLAKAHSSKKKTHEVVTSLRHPQEVISDREVILKTLGRLWLHGVEVDWNAFNKDENRKKVPLPTYPFEHKPYWIEPGKTSYSSQKKDIKEALSKTENIDDWFYIPVWKQEKDLTDILSNLKQKKLKWLIFSGEKEIDKILADKLNEYEQEIITIKTAENYKEINKNNFLIDLYDYDDYRLLVSRLVELGKIPDKIIHTWNYEKKYDKKIDNLDEINNAGFYCLLRLAKAFGEEGIDNSISLAAVTKGLQKLTEDEISYPENAALLGPIKVISKEYLNLNCRSLDFGNSDDEKINSEIIISELLKNDDRNVIAYRNSKRFIQEFESVNIDSNNGSSIINIKEKGVYLLTGGFGGIGFTLAAYLAKQYHAKLILLGRQSLPPRSSWDNLSSITNGNEKTHKVIQKVKELESYGAEVTAYSADVTDKARMTEVVSDIKRKFGKINGVIHSAGVINDGVIQTKPEDSAQKVLNPKMIGTIILDELMKEFKPDFFLLFSSTSSIFGPAGQIDYTAANAFLDLYAQSKPAGNGNTKYTTINWGQWRDVGMAARLASQMGLGPD
jgi:acyl transferase domain-containing protein